MMSDIAVDCVLRGAFLEQDYEQWRLPSFSLKYFVSSTFTDTHNERNVIMTKLLQELNDTARLHGIDITFVDMRWGVKDENTDDHKTWDACRVELERCRDESCGSFFISLQGYKYGYRPLPREINQVDFDNHVQNYHDIDKNELLEVAEKWYILDTNAVPPNYVLAKLDSTNRNDYWCTDLSKLLKLLNGLIFEGELCIGDSVTNWEAIAALSNASRIFWMKRDIIEAITDVQDQSNEYDDTRGSTEVQERLTKLKDTMMQTLDGNSRVHTTVIDSLTSLKSKSSEYDAYISEFYDKLKSVLMQEVNEAIHKKDEWNRDAFNTGLRGEVCADLLHHYSWAREKVKDFEGREEIVRTAMRCISQDNVNPTNSLSGVILCVVGKSGCGKTCLMAKLASLLYSPDGVPVVIRFCGINDDSSSGLKLLQSIVRQIHHVYRIVSDATRDSYTELVTYFQSLLLAYPVILLIDSIDQLSNDQQERSKISFLDKVIPHPQTRIIVSCLPDDAVTSTWYGCDTELKRNHVTRVEVASVADEIEVILDSFLVKKSRNLTQNQRDIVLASAHNDSCALFLKLAARVVCTWSSFETTCALSASVPSLIHQIFDSIEHNYGKLLVQAVIAFTTLAVRGVTSREMEDLLTLDEAVMDEVNKYNKSTRLPSHVWLRVKHELTGLLVESDQGCMKWYHRQLWETASTRYNQDKKVYYHQIMGRYFGDIHNDVVIASKGISRNPLVLQGGSESIWYRSSNGYINKRRCAEAGHHLAEGNLFLEAINELCTLPAVCAAVKTGNGFRLVKTLIKIVYGISASDPVPASKLNRARHYMLWLRKEMNAILLNEEVNVVGTATKEPSDSVVKKDVVELLDAYRGEGCSTLSCMAIDHVFVKKRAVGSVDQSDSCLMHLIGHQRAVENLHLSESGKLTSVSADGTIRVWDNVSGEVMSVLHSNCKGVKSLCYNHDESVLFTGSFEGVLHAWNPFTTECLRMVPDAHSDIIRSMCYNGRTSRLFTASADRTIKVWDAASIESLKVVAALTDNVLGLYSIISSSTGSFLVSGGNDQLIKVWNLHRFECVKTLVGHYGTVMCVHCSRDETLLLSAGGADFAVKLWDLDSGECVRTYVGHTHTVSYVVFTEEETRLVSSGWDKTVRVWDVESGTELNLYRAHSSWVNAVICQHGKIYSASSDNSIKIWDYGENRCVCAQHTDYVTCLCGPADFSVVISGSWDSSIKVWDARKLELLCTCTGHTNKVNAICCNPRGTVIVSGSDDETIRVWDIAGSNGYCNLVIEYSIGVRAVCLTHDEAKIVSGSDDGLINIWNRVNGELFFSLTGHTGAVESLLINKSDTKVVSTGGDYLDRDSSVKIWDLEQRQCQRTLVGHTESVYCAHFNEDESLLVTCSIDKTIKLWDASSGEALHTLVGHSDSVSSVRFSADSAVILSGSKDGSVRVWDWQSGACIHTIHGITSNVLGVTAVLCLEGGAKVVAAADVDVFLFESCMH